MCVNYTGHIHNTHKGVLMGDKSHECILGSFHCTGNQSATDDLLARKYFHADFAPSEACIELMNHVSEGIEGIAAVIPTNHPDSTFALVFDRGVFPDAVASIWITAFRKALQSVPKDGRIALIGTRTPIQNPDAELVLIYSDRYTTERE